MLPGHIIIICNGCYLIAIFWSTSQPPCGAYFKKLLKQRTYDFINPNKQVVAFVELKINESMFDNKDYKNKKKKK